MSLYKRGYDIMPLEYVRLNIKDCFSGWTGVNIPEELEKQSGMWVTKAGVRQFPNGAWPARFHRKSGTHENY